MLGDGFSVFGSSSRSAPNVNRYASQDNAVVGSASEESDEAGADRDHGGENEHDDQDDVDEDDHEEFLSHREKWQESTHDHAERIEQHQHEQGHTPVADECQQKKQQPTFVSIPEPEIGPHRGKEVSTRWLCLAISQHMSILSAILQFLGCHSRRYGRNGRE